MWPDLKNNTAENTILQSARLKCKHIIARQRDLLNICRGAGVRKLFGNLLSLIVF